MNQKGCIISKMYEDVIQTDEFSYQNGNYTLNTSIKIEDGIIQFDEKKTHIRNLENILRHYYDIDAEVTYQELKNLERKNGFDAKEMYFAHLLASKGEPTCLFVNVESEDMKESVTSSILFLPENADGLTQKQRQKLMQLLKETNTSMFEIALCNGNIEEMGYLKKKEDVMAYLGLFPRGVILTKKYEKEEMKKTISYLNGDKLEKFPLVIHDGKIVLSDTLNHAFQLHMIIKSLFLMEYTLSSSFYQHDKEENRFGFHKNEIELASFLASLGEIPIIYVEGIFAGHKEIDAKMQNEKYCSMMLFLPSNFNLITEKQLQHLASIPRYLTEEEIRYFEIAIVSQRPHKNEYLKGVDAFKVLSQLQDILEEKQNMKKSRR